MSLLAYRIASWLLTPLFLMQLAWRARIERSGPIHLAARYGFGDALTQRSIWIHAVSVGEVQAAVPLVVALRERHPNTPIVVTCTTPTGMAHAQRLLSMPSVTLRFLPLDLPGAVRRFLDRIQPCVGIVLETEIWPQLFRECGRRGVPLTIVSARLSERSVRGYRRVAGLLRETLGTHVSIAAQSEIDAERFRSLGVPAERVSICGNLKFDFTPPASAMEQLQDLRRRYAIYDRFVWIAASTHEGEESAVLETQQRLQAAGLDALLIMAPRHPRRFDAVAALIESSGLSWWRLSTMRESSAAAPIGEGVSVMLLDTLGDLLAHYGLAQVAFVGGSWVKVGGHNLLEPLSMGAATLTGPHLFNSPEVARGLIDTGAVTIVDDASGLERELQKLAQHPDERARRAAHARAQLQASRGALTRVLALIEKAL